MTTIGARIRDAREAAGLTQAALAISSGTNLRTLCRYEKGESVPDGAALVRLCVALSVSADYLLGTPRSENMAARAAVGGAIDTSATDGEVSAAELMGLHSDHGGSRRSARKAGRTSRGAA